MLKHSKKYLQAAVTSAGSQTKLAEILQIPTSQLSSWLRESNIQMPIKYGLVIEHFTQNHISLNMLFPSLSEELNLTRAATPLQIKEIEIEMLLLMAKEAGVGLKLSVTLDKDKVKSS